MTKHTDILNFAKQRRGMKFDCTCQCCGDVYEVTEFFTFCEWCQEDMASQADDEWTDADWRQFNQDLREDARRNG